VKKKKINLHNKSKTEANQGTLNQSARAAKTRSTKHHLRDTTNPPPKNGKDQTTKPNEKDESARRNSLANPKRESETDGDRAEYCKDGRKEAERGHAMFHRPIFYEQSRT